MTRITTHVLDTARGVPAHGVEVHLVRVSGDERAQLTEAFTNADGRTDAPMLEGPPFRAGTYELIFQIGPYFADSNADLEDPPFLDVVTIRFTIADAATPVHIPLLVSPWSYSTYRGS